MGSTTWTASELIAFAKRQHHHAVAAALEFDQQGNIIGAGGEVPTATAPGRLKSPTRAKYSHSVVLAYFEEQGLPEPTFEHRFDFKRKWRFDVAWPEHKLAVECDGGLWTGGAHNRGARMKKTWERDNRAACLGWRILRCEPTELCLLSTVELIKRCL